MKNTEELNNQLIARLEEITQRGISKADMARIVGVTPQAVNGWFKKGVISKKSAIAPRGSCQCVCNLVVGEKVSEDSGLKPNESKMLRLFRQLPEAEQERMIDTFEVRLKEIDIMLRNISVVDLRLATLTNISDLTMKPANAGFLPAAQPQSLQQLPVSIKAKVCTCINPILTSNINQCFNHSIAASHRGRKPT
jgi:hypothetical protein